MEKQWKQWQGLSSWAPKSLQRVTAAMKLRHLLPGRKAMTNLDSILKSRDITLLRKVCLVKAMVFPVVMCGCERWTMDLCWQVISLLFNTLSRFVTVFLPRSKTLLIFWLQSLSTVILQPYKICHSSHFFSSYLPWSDGTRCHDFSFLNVEF